MPPEVMGLPTWVLNGLSVGSLITFILVALTTDRLWTKGQVNRLIEQHKETLVDARGQYREAIQSIKDRYETHLSRTVELWKGRVEDAVRREGEWREVALKWQEVASTLSDSLDPVQEANETILSVLQEMQRLQPVRRPR